MTKTLIYSLYMVGMKSMRDQTHQIIYNWLAQSHKITYLAESTQQINSHMQVASKIYK
jgi:hypothetical protein